MGGRKLQDKELSRGDSSRTLLLKEIEELNNITGKEYYVVFTRFARRAQLFVKISSSKFGMRVSRMQKVSMLRSLVQDMIVLEGGPRRCK
jgi:hypothetical protein